MPRPAPRLPAPDPRGWGGGAALGWACFRIVFVSAWRRLTPVLLPPWLAGMWFVANFGPILDWRQLAAALAAAPFPLRAALGAGWIAAWAWAPRRVVARLLEEDLAFLQRAPLRHAPRGLLFAGVLVDVALVPALLALLWPTPVWAFTSFVAGGLVATVAFGRGRGAIGLTAALVGGLGPGPLVAPFVLPLVGWLAAAPTRARPAARPAVPWTPRTPLGALLYREWILLRGLERGLPLTALGVALPLGVLFRGFRHNATFAEGELGRAAAFGLLGVGLVGGALVARLVSRLGWPPVPRHWPVRASLRLLPLGLVVAACLVPTSLAFAAAGVPGSWSAGTPFLLTAGATVVAAPAAVLLSRGEGLGLLLGWTIAALVLLALGSPVADGGLLLGALALGRLAATRVDRPERG